jgi:hypothetical protein
MDINGNRVTITLARRELLTVAIEGHTKVECVEGSLWITQHRDCNDTLLSAGESVTLTYWGPAIVQALEDARFVVKVFATLPNRLANAAQLLVEPDTEMRSLFSLRGLLRAPGFD